MADDNNTSVSSSRRDGAWRGDRSGGNRSGGNREPGGFRIRLSDNEMQAARALQDAFGLRSTVAVLGFSLRTLAQQLEQGQLDEFVAQHRAQAGSRGPAPGGRSGEPRRDRRQERGPRVDPFARPSKPAPAAALDAEVEPEAAASPEAPADGGSAEAAADEPASTATAPEETAPEEAAPAETAPPEPAAEETVSDDASGSGEDTRA